MKTQIINFAQATPCFRTYGFGGMEPDTLSGVDYEVSNLLIKMDYITFDLYYEEEFIGHYIVLNVSLTKNDDGSMDATHQRLPRYKMIILQKNL